MKGDGGRQHRRNAELLAHLLFGGFQGLIDGFDRGLEAGDSALLGQNVLFPVPLVHVNGVNGAVILVGAQGAHVGEQAFSGRYAQFAQPQPLPFGQRVHHHGALLVKGFNGKSYGPLHAVQVVVDARAIEHHNGGRHFHEVQLAGQLLGKGFFHERNGLFGFEQASRYGPD